MFKIKNVSHIRKKTFFYNTSLGFSTQNQGNARKLIKLKSNIRMADTRQNLWAQPKSNKKKHRNTKSAKLKSKNFPKQVVMGATRQNLLWGSSKQ
jgi:hypothetical protein